MEIPAERQTVADVRHTETFRQQVSVAMPARIDHLPPERRRAVQRTGAFVLGFTELISIMIDLHRQDGNRRHPPTLKWIPDARAWKFI